MSAYIFITYIVFGIKAYLYLYALFDKCLLYSTSGSKILKLTNKTNKVKKVFGIFNNQKNVVSVVIKYSILLFISLLLFLINYALTIQTFYSNYWVVTLFNKTINFSQLFNENIQLISTGYYLVSAVAILSFILGIKKHLTPIISYIAEVVEKNTEQNQQINDICINDTVNIGRDSQSKTVSLDITELTKNMLITGSIGCGKTTSAIAPICFQLISKGYGGLILDAKGNFVDTIKAICEKNNRLTDLKIISMDSNNYFELLDNNICPMEFANRVRKVLELLSSTVTSEPYWLDKVENVLQNFVIITDFLQQKRDVLELHKMITDDEYLQYKLQQCKEKLVNTKCSEKECYELNNAVLFITKEYLALDVRVSSIIKSELTRLTIPLITEFDIYNQFATSNSNKEKIEFCKESFNQSKIVVLSINVGQYKSLMKIVATFMKLSFQKAVMSNIKSNPYIFFIADEYQEFVNASDAHFLSISREAKCMNILSTQSYMSIKNELKDESATLVIIQNLVNKIWFRNDDTYTVTEIVKQLGKVDSVKTNESIAENAKESRKYLLRKGFKNRNSSISKTINYVVSKENEYDENFFTRSLKTFEALAFIPNEEGIMLPQKILLERGKYEKNNNKQV